MKNRSHGGRETPREIVGAHAVDAQRGAVGPARRRPSRAGNAATARLAAVALSPVETSVSKAAMPARAAATLSGAGAHLVGPHE